MEFSQMDYCASCAGPVRGVGQRAGTAVALQVQAHFSALLAWLFLPVLRAEGLTELIGDIVLTCTGGATPDGRVALIPTANFTVSFGTNVTSRLLNYNSLPTSSVTSPNTSEALLLIDEPGSGLQVAPPVPGGTAPTGFGPQRSPDPLHAAVVNPPRIWARATAAALSMFSSSAATM